MANLAIVVVTLENTEGTTTFGSELIVPTDLPSIEEELLKIAAAMKGIETRKLTKWM